MRPMSPSLFFLAVVSLLYLALALRLKGSVVDRVVIIGLRSLFFLSLLTLFLSPRFEMVYQEWTDPLFMVLEDDSPSLKYQDSSRSNSSEISKLEGSGDVIRRKFSDNSVLNPYSISSQVSSLAQDSQIRAAILFSDGNEVGGPYQGRSAVPVFTVGSGSESFPDHQVSLDTFPRQVFLDQMIIFRGQILSNSKQAVSGILRVRMDGKVILEEPHDLAPNNNSKPTSSTSFSFSHQFLNSGEKRVSLDFEALGSEKITANNRIEFFLEVSEEKNLVLVLAGAPNPDLAFYLRELKADPALQVETRYLNARYPIVKPGASLRKKPSLLLLHHLSWDRIGPILEGESLMEIPRLIIPGLESEVLSSYQKNSFFAFKGHKPYQVGKIRSWDYVLNKGQFPAFRFYDHEGFEKTVLSSFPLLKELGPPIETRRDSIVAFEMRIDARNHPLVLVQRKDPVQALINSSDLSRIAFSPLARDEHQSFFSRMVRSLAGWLMDVDRVGGLEVRVPRIHLVEGETFRAAFNGPSRYQVSLIKRGGARLFSAPVPLKLARKLEVGNYQLQVHQGSERIKSFPIHVGFDPNEFQKTGKNVSYLEDVARRSGGRYLGSEPVDLVENLPGNMLQKKLELRHEKVDLQENIFLALVLLSLISGEWIYRYIKRLV